MKLRSNDPRDKDRTVVRVAVASLECLSLKLPYQFPMPDEIPDTHQVCEDDSRADGGRAACRGAGGRGRAGGGRAGGRGGRRGTRAAPLASKGARKRHCPSNTSSSESEVDEQDKDKEDDSEHGEVQQGERRKAQKGRRVVPSSPSSSSSSPYVDLVEDFPSHRSLQSSSEEESEHQAGPAPPDSSDEDEPAPIPNDFARLADASAWKPSDHIDAFMLWSALDTGKNPRWHCLKVAKVLNDERWTYDAHVLGRPRELRGVKVTRDLLVEGVFIPLLCAQPASAASSSQQPGLNAEEQTLHTSNNKPSPNQHQYVEPPQSRTRRAQHIRLPFFCNRCKQTDSFLYCPPDSVDGVAPDLLCMQCKPSTWVSISRADYARAVNVDA